MADDSAEITTKHCSSWYVLIYLNWVLDLHIFLNIFALCIIWLPELATVSNEEFSFTFHKKIFCL